RLEPVQAIPETFRANNGGQVSVVPPGNGIPPATLIVPRRNHGPIVQLDQAAGTALSIQYAGYSATQELDAFLTWMRAKNLSDFEKGLRSFDVGSQNWSYADRRGHIAYFTSGELPLREDLQAGHVDGVPPYLVRNGTGGNEWLPAVHHYPGQALPYEILPMAEMPHTVNPGYDGLRAGRITEALKAALRHGKLDAGDIQRIQDDTVLLDAEFFAPRIGAALLRARTSDEPQLRALARDPKVVEAVVRLAAWDHSTPTGIPQGYDAADVNGHLSAPSAREKADSVAATLYAVWRSRFLASTTDAVARQLDAPAVDGQRALTALKRALSGVPSASGVDFFAAPGVADPKDRQALAMLKAVRAAVDRLASPDFAAAYGGSTRISDYTWGTLHRLTLGSVLGGPFSAPP